MKQQIKNGDRVNCPFYVPPKEFLATINQIKSIAGRVWDPKEKIWTVPFSIENSRQLEKFGFTPYGEIAEILHPHVDKPRLPEPQETVDLSLLPPTLRPYQIEAIQFLEWTEWKGVLALSPRLGKSVCSLAGYILHGFSPVVIVTTAAGKPVWKEEIKKWLEKEAYIVSGVTPYSIYGVEFVIINYDILSDWVEEIQKVKPQLLIADEIHKCSAPEMYILKSKAEYEQECADAEPEDVQKVKKGKMVPVQCTQAFQELARTTPHIVPLSGTPATKCVRQMQVVLGEVDKRHFGNRFYYLHRYCDPQKGRYGWTYDGISHEEELTRRLRSVMFRRTKEDVIKDLPKENHIFLPCEVDKEQYDREFTELRRWYESHPSMTEDEIAERLAHFESLSYSSKRGAILEWIEDFIESGEKLVVFCWHRVTCEDIYRKFKKKAVLVYGGITPKNREANIKTFNEDAECSLFVGQVESCKEAISLYAADTVLYAELPATSGSLQQSSERVWLPQLHRDNLWYYYPVAEDTIDKKRVEVLKDRARVLGQLYGDSKESYTLFENKLRDYIDKESYM